VSGPLSVSVDALATLPLGRDRYFFRPDTTLHTVPGVGGCASLALLIALP
jgi:hypothetical protein